MKSVKVVFRYVPWLDETHHLAEYEREIQFESYKDLYKKILETKWELPWQRVQIHIPDLLQLSGDDLRYLKEKSIIE